MRFPAYQHTLNGPSSLFGVLDDSNAKAARFLRFDLQHGCGNDSPISFKVIPVTLCNSVHLNMGFGHHAACRSL